MKLPVSIIVLKEKPPNIPMINQINNFMDIVDWWLNIHFSNILPYEYKS